MEFSPNVFSIYFFSHSIENIEWCMTQHGAASLNREKLKRKKIYQKNANDLPPKLSAQVGYNFVACFFLHLLFFFKKNFVRSIGIQSWSFAKWVKLFESGKKKKFISTKWKNNTQYLLENLQLTQIYWKQYNVVGIVFI